MNFSIDAAQEALKNPSDELKALLDDPKVSKGALNAVRAEGFKPDSKPREDVSGLGDGRLQVVNEKQEFRSV
jgi:hypothetical protein